MLVGLFASLPLTSPPPLLHAHIPLSINNTSNNIGMSNMHSSISNSSSSSNSNSSLHGEATNPNFTPQGINAVSRTSSTVSSISQPCPIRTSAYFLQYYKPMPGQLAEAGTTDNTVSSFGSGFSSSNLISSSSTCSVQSGLTTGSERTGYGEEGFLEGDEDEDEDEDEVFEGFEVSEIERGMRGLGGGWER